MHDYFTAYANVFTERFSSIIKHERAKIEKGADLMVAAIERDELIHVIGTGGHSTMGALELFWRAGGLAPINPLLDASFLPSNGALHSNIMERTEGLAQGILKSYKVKSGETLIIVNAYGINATTIDTALEAKRIGMHTIGITSTSFSSSLPRDSKIRHSSGKNLHELVDIFIDCNLPLGDACVSVEGFEQKVAPSSTILNSFCLNLLVIATVEKLVAKGIEPPVWMSANLPRGDENNARWHDKYNYRVKHLV